MIATANNIRQIELLRTEMLVAAGAWEQRSWREDRDLARRLELKRRKVHTRIAYRRLISQVH
jgi:hypothetical protein